MQNSPSAGSALQGPARHALHTSTCTLLLLLLLLLPSAQLLLLLPGCAGRQLESLTAACGSHLLCTGSKPCSAMLR
jgi:hypothetical protein